MSMIIALGSNLGDKLLNLKRAKWVLASHFDFIAESSIYKSKAQYYNDQPDFLNQVLEFESPKDSPDSIMSTLLEIEESLGRERSIPKGPRVIDIDFIFLDNQTIKSDIVEIPHPRWSERDFVLYPLKELPFYDEKKSQLSLKEVPINQTEIYLN